jgi:hypothetical protein
VAYTDGVHSSSRGIPPALPVFLTVTAVVLVMLAPAAPAGPWQITGFTLAALELAALPWLLHAAGQRPGAGSTRTGVITAAVVGAVVGGILLSFVPMFRTLTDDFAGTGTGTGGQGNPDAAEGTGAGEHRFQELWEDTLHAVESASPGSTQRLDDVRMQGDQVWVTYLDERGATFDMYNMGGRGWNDPSPGIIASNRQNIFDAAVVTADLDATADAVLGSSRPVADRLSVIDLEVGKADGDIVVDTPGREHVVADSGEALITVGLDPLADQNIPTFSFEAMGDGSQPAVIAGRDDIGANHRLGASALQAAGQDPDTTVVTGFTVDGNPPYPDYSAQVDLSGGRWAYLDWTPGTFVRQRVESAGGDDLPVGLLYRDLDIAGLDRAVLDARTRGGYAPGDYGRDYVSLTYRDLWGDGAEVTVKISDDPTATGIYDAAGVWLRPVG